MLDENEFVQSTLAAQDLATAQADPKYVDTDIVNYDLGTEAPYPFTLLYRDGNQLVIPLARVFSEGLPSGTVTVMRRHAATGRIIPFRASTTDPALRDPALSSLPADEAFSRVLKPRFDPDLTPNIEAMVREAQSIFLAKGILSIIALRATAPALRGGAAAAGRGVAGAVAKGASRPVLSKVGTVTVEATVAKGALNPAGKLVSVMRAIQSRFVVNTPKSLMEGYKIIGEATKSVGLEPGIVKSGTFVSEALEIANVGNVTTTILKTGEIIVRQHGAIILRLIP